MSSAETVELINAAAADVQPFAVSSAAAICGVASEPTRCEISEFFCELCCNQSSCVSLTVV